MDEKINLWLNEGRKIKHKLEERRHVVANKTADIMEEFSKGNKVAVTNYIMSLYLEYNPNNIPDEFLRDIAIADEEDFNRNVYSFFAGLHSKN